jgi:hypothetical protein
MIDHLNSIKPKGHSNFKDSIMQYKRLIGSRSLLVLISDFLVDSKEILESLYLLGDQEIKVIQVLDRVEKNLSMGGDYKLTDSETKNKLRTFISPRMRVKYQNQLNAHCSKIEDMCNQLGIEYQLVTTNTPIFDAFYKILEGN